MLLIVRFSTSWVLTLFPFVLQCEFNVIGLSRKIITLLRDEKETPRLPSNPKILFYRKRSQKNEEITTKIVSRLFEITSIASPLKFKPT